jgi:hypothetical protein
VVKFGEPPPVAVLAAIPPDLHPLPPGQELVRVYFQGGPHPTTWNAFRHFGPVGARFDHHLPPPRVQARGILYAAVQATTCLAEVFQAQRLLDRTLDEPWLVGLVARQPLRLLDLTGAWPTRAGASMAIGTGFHARARRWSQAIYAAYPDIDGLWYSSSMHANRPAVALYERAAPRLEGEPLYHRALADPLLAGKLAYAAALFGWPIR